MPYAFTVAPTPLFLAMGARFQPKAAGELAESYEVRVGNRVFEVPVEDGRLRRIGAAAAVSAAREVRRKGRSSRGRSLFRGAASVSAFGAGCPAEHPR
jgi:hypothetical protein